MGEIREIRIELLDPSPFETREAINPLSSHEVLVPLVARPKGERFEVVCGHRRLETFRSKGAATAKCEVRELDDESAARLLYLENEDREGLSDYARGMFFSKYMIQFGISEREAGKRLGVNVSTVSLCLAIVRGKERVFAGANTSDPILYESVVTTHKIREVNSLPNEKRIDTLQAVVENRLSTDETEAVVSQIQAGQKVQDAVVTVVNERETRKSDEYRAKQKGRTSIRCRVCRIRLQLVHRNDGSHVLDGV
ncbi:MAG: ParB N-terminal domain-containing protein [Nitrososphaerales archaeon]|jgi:ParB family chromosome partitioning protein